MVEGSRKKAKTQDSAAAAGNLATMGKTDVTAQIKLADGDVECMERKFAELGAKIDNLALQLKALQPTVQEHKMTAVSAGPSEKKNPETSHQASQPDVIYVRKPGEFQFYS